MRSQRKAFLVFGIIGLSALAVPASAGASDGVIPGPIDGTTVDAAAVGSGAPNPEGGVADAASPALSPEAAAVLRWNRFLGGAAASAATKGPAGKVLVGSDQGLAVLAESNGAISCRYPTSGSIGTVLNGPNYDAGTGAAVVGTSAGIVASVRTSNCTRRWSVNPGLGAALVTSSNDVVAATFPGARRTIGYSRTSGAVLWNINWNYTPTDTRFSSTGFLYLGVGPFIVSVDGTNGSLEWYRYFGSNITGRPAVPNNGYVYFPVAGYVYAFDAFTGDYRWNRFIGTATQLVGVGSNANGHRVVATTATGRVQQLNATSGATICTTTLGGSFSQRGVGDGTNFNFYATNSGNGRTYRINQNCGVVWSTVTGSSPNGLPSLINNNLYVPSIGTLYSYRK